MRELLSAESERKGTDLGGALKYFQNTTRQKSIAFIISDLIDTNYTPALRVAGNKHDIVGIKLYDKMDRYLPNLGMLRVKDAESGDQKWIDTSSKLVRYEYEKEFFRETDYGKNGFKKAVADLLHVKTDEDYMKVLQTFLYEQE